MQFESKVVKVNEKDANGQTVKGPDGKAKVVASEKFSCPVWEREDLSVADEALAEAGVDLGTVVDWLNYATDLKLRAKVRDRIDPYKDVSLEQMRSQVMVHLSRQANSADEEIAAEAQQLIQQFILAEANGSGKAWIKAKYAELSNKGPLG